MIKPGDQKIYNQNGFVHLRHRINPDELNQFAAILRPLMEQLNPNKISLETRSTYRRAFTQVTNLWRKSDAVKAFVFRADLARLAAEVMGVKGVRLYHDQALFKEAGGGPTPWHVDQVYWPMDTVKTCTFWIPLQNVSREMGSLTFAQGSHRVDGGRDMVISDESETFFSNWVKEQGFKISEDEFELGDISVHAGWTVHRAGANFTDRKREVMTIIYMAEDACLLETLTPTQLVDRDAFTPGIKPGERISTVLNPALYANEK
ncbi:MAG: phytanoyl-CoA dioxygenase family protein [Candidatus Marinimicrobia bacterium]|nr:phytanoyl-CoA dioxygenase family protein [Candidatus Neomarinimicrobiota bacterium]